MYQACGVLSVGRTLELLGDGGELARALERAQGEWVRITIETAAEDLPAQTEPWETPVEPEPVEIVYGAADSLMNLDGVGPEIAGALRAAGFQGLNAVRAASDRALLRIPGIGPATLRKIRAQL